MILFGYLNDEKVLNYCASAKHVLALKYVFSSSRKEQSEMRPVLLFLYISTSVPVIRGTLSKTDAIKLNKAQEAEVRTLWK